MENKNFSDHFVHNCSNAKMESIYMMYITIENLSKRYSGVENPVLDIDKPFTIPLNSMVVVLGYSGSGKSTLVNILSLIDVPDIKHFRTQKKPIIIFQMQNEQIVVKYVQISNKIVIKPFLIENKNDGKGRYISPSYVRNKYFSYIFQEPYLHPNFNIEKNIKTPLFINKETLEEKNITEIISHIGLKEHGKKYINEISGGEKQRVSILRGLISENPIIFGDELTSNIDINKAQDILYTIKQRVNTKNQSFIWVTHDLHLTQRYADNIITIKDAKLLLNNNTGDINDLLEFMQISSTEKKNKLSNEPTYTKIKVNFKEKCNYFFSYALLDLFKKRKVKRKYLSYRPTTDFLISFFSIFFILLFLLSIMKMGYATNKFLSIKLSDPRINNLKITSSRELALDLTNQDINDIKLKIGKNLRHITPIYMATISIKKYKSTRTSLSHTNPFTFERNDPILSSIIKEKKEFLTSESKINGIIIKKEIFEKSLKYPPHINEIEISINKVKTVVPVIKTEQALPLDSIYMIRKEFYLKSYDDSNLEKKPMMSFILLYPNDIHEITKIINAIENMTDGGIKKYEIDDASDLLNKLEIISEIELLIYCFTTISLIAILIISIAYTFITIFRNINKKRNEIGVFLAYGMKKSFFYTFYLIEGFILWLTTTIVSYLIYWLTIQPMIDNYFTSGKFDLALYIKDSIKIPIENSHLALPYEWILGLYGASFFIVCIIFILLISRIINKLPVQLMKEI